MYILRKKSINSSLFPQNTDLFSVSLKETYPEYFGLSAANGLEVYVWQMSPASYSFALLEGTDREKSLAELLNIKAAVKYPRLFLTLLPPNGI